jgi:hypothetical protein
MQAVNQRCTYILENMTPPPEWGKYRWTAVELRETINGQVQTKKVKILKITRKMKLKGKTNEKGAKIKEKWVQEE